LFQQFEAELLGIERYCGVDVSDEVSDYGHAQFSWAMKPSRGAATHERPDDCAAVSERRISAAKIAVGNPSRVDPAEDDRMGETVDLRGEVKPQGSGGADHGWQQHQPTAGSGSMRRVRLHSTQTKRIPMANV
jgi:hypothetical protein